MMKITVVLVFVLAATCIVSEASKNLDFQFKYKRILKEENVDIDYDEMQFIHYTAKANMGKSLKVKVKGDVGVYLTEIFEDEDDLKKYGEAMSVPSEFTIDIDPAKSKPMDSSKFFDPKTVKENAEGEININFGKFINEYVENDQFLLGFSPPLNFNLKAELKGLCVILEVIGDVKINVLSKKAYFSNFQIKKVKIPKDSC